MVESNKIFGSIITILSVLLTILFSALVLSAIFNAYDNTLDSSYASDNESLVYVGSTTLTPIGDGVTSATAKTYNNSYMYFDGVNDYINITDDSDLNMTGKNFSISIWFYNIVDDSSGSSARFLSKRGTGGLNYIFGIQDGEGYIRVETSGLSDNDIVSEGLYANLYSWVNAVFVYNGTTKMIYVNGVLDKSELATGSVTDESNTAMIGRDSNGETHFIDGSLDELRVYNKSLSQSQITEIYNSGRQANSSLPSDGLVLWYSFDEQTGTTVYDKSGNGNHAV